MGDLAYVNFDLNLRRKSAGTYKIEVTSAGGNPACDFQLPFNNGELEELRHIVTAPARDAEVEVSGARQGLSSDDDYQRLVRLYGGRLYDSVFANQVAASMAISLQEAQRTDQGVRIRVHLGDAPELADLPWEYLYDRATETHLALTETTPIVRYLNLATPPTSLLVKPPLNILVMIAAPKDCPRLDGEREWKNICEALDGLIKAKLVSVVRVPRATRGELLACLQKGNWHIFHFIGHGGLSKKQQPALLLEDDAGRSDPIELDALKVALGHRTLRLAVLNSCDGARALTGDPFSGLAQGLLKAKIPAVIAMQFKITDRGAIQFARDFYSALAQNLPVDRSLAEARKAMYLASNPTEWGTPVLFMCGDDARIFLIDRPTEDQLRERQIKALSDDAKLDIDARRWADAIQKLEDLKKLGT